ncbi:hypothetical protein ABW48_05985 [Pluralibacter gergoviae]|nr:hypothetical protein ABW48_05985 [Pluralibacter gergoviae]
MGKGGNELVLSIEKGQIVCDVSACDVLLRRNEEKPFRVTMEHPKDNSQNVLIGRLSAKEFGDLKSADKITTEITIFQNGESILEFDTKNNPFKGMVVYTIDELNNKLKLGDDINVIKTGELDIGEAGFAACRKILKSEKINPEEEIVQIIKDAKDLYVKVSYSESNKIFTTCKKGNKAMHLDVYQYQ